MYNAELLLSLWLNSLRTLEEIHKFCNALKYSETLAFKEHCLLLSRVIILKIPRNTIHEKDSTNYHSMRSKCHHYNNTKQKCTQDELSLGAWPCAKVLHKNQLSFLSQINKIVVGIKNQHYEDGVVVYELRGENQSSGKCLIKWAIKRQKGSGIT